MQKIKFDFEATKERIYAPNSNVPIGAPVDRNGNIANDGNAYGIVLCKETENEKYWVKYNLVVMVAGYCDIIDAQEIWGDEYSAEAIAAMSDIIFCDDHKIGGGGGWPADLPKPSVGGYGYTEQGEQTVIVDNESVTTDGTVMVSGVFAESFVLEIGSSYTAIVNGSEYDVTGKDAGGGAVSVGAEFAADIGVDFSVYPFMVLYKDGEGVVLVTQTAGTYTVTIKKSSETVHKIDEKYLPASGGAMVVNFTAGAGGFMADKTPQEIVSAFNSGTFVYAVLMGAQSLTLSVAYVEDDEYFNIKFDSIAFVSGGGLIVQHLEWDDDDSAWKYSQAVLPIN